MWWNGCLSIVKMATPGLKTEAWPRVPTWRMNEPGRAGERVPGAVPQRGQKQRVTARSRSLHATADGSPLVILKPDSGTTNTATG
jgi:hypothetical protein